MNFKEKISLLFKDEKIKNDVSILAGDAILEPMDKTHFVWSQTCSKKDVLEFKNAFQIRHSNDNKGIRDCTYMIHNRKFVDLSCMEGEAVVKINDEYEGSTYPDGSKFIYHCDSIPTFDSGDREWHQWAKLVVYADKDGINLIYCAYGYKIPRIDIYIGLKKAGMFFEKYIEYLECGDFKIQICDS